MNESDFYEKKIESGKEGVRERMREREREMKKKEKERRGEHLVFFVSSKVPPKNGIFLSCFILSYFWQFFWFFLPSDSCIISRSSEFHLKNASLNWKQMRVPVLCLKPREREREKKKFITKNPLRVLLANFSQKTDKKPKNETT